MGSPVQAPDDSERSSRALRRRWTCLSSRGRKLGEERPSLNIPQWFTHNSGTVSAIVEIKQPPSTTSSSVSPPPPAQISSLIRAEERLSHCYSSPSNLKHPSRPHFTCKRFGSIFYAVLYLHFTPTILSCSAAPPQAANQIRISFFRVFHILK